MNTEDIGTINPAKIPLRKPYDVPFFSLDYIPKPLMVGVTHQVSYSRSGISGGESPPTYHSAPQIGWNLHDATGQFRS